MNRLGQTAALDGPIALVAASPPGARLAARLARAWPKAECYVLARYLPDGADARPLQPPISEAVAGLFARCRGLVVFLPVGAVVRLVAPCLRDKFRDPAVVAVDDGGRYAISVLSSHEGGGNRLAEGVAAVLGAQAIITTASERAVVLGLGCSRGVSLEELEGLVRAILAETGCGPAAVRLLATLEPKLAEPGVRAFVQRWRLDQRGFSAAELARVVVPHPSEVVRKAVGTPSVAEAAALLASGAAGLLVPKRRSAHATVALASWIR
jgi:cobalt-precorrin 5A hydrolase